MKIKLIFFTLICCFLLSACSSTKNQVSCKMKPLKHKRYSSKKPKARKTRNYSASAPKQTRTNKPNTPTSSSKPAVVIEEEVVAPVQVDDVIVDTPEIKEPIIDKPEPIEKPIKEEPEKIVEEAPLSIADTKVNIPPAEEEINLEEIVEELKDGEFSFDKNIEFIDQSDLFQNRAKALTNISELAKVLKNNPDLMVTVVGNTATEEPDGEKIYGSSLPVYSQPGILNNKDVTIYDVMIARANRVKQLLINNGVSEQQIKRKAGSHRKYAKDRVVTFILKRY